MRKEEALRRLQTLKGKELHELAREYGVTFRTADGKINKGWAGQVIERHLGIQLNTSRSPNLGSWELKVIPLKYLRSGKLVIKETMAVTMIDSNYVRDTPFENSHLWTKLQRFILVARIVGETAEDPTSVYKVVAVEIARGSALYKQIQEDYYLVQWTIRYRDFSRLTGRMGVYIQPRTKGSKGSDTRAFYARKEFLKQVLAIPSL